MTLLKPAPYLIRIALILMGLYAVIRGIAYLPFARLSDGLPRGLELISEIITIELWATTWILIGAFSIFSAITAYKNNIAWALIVAIMIAWGSAFSIGAIESLFSGENSRDYLSATSYLMPAIVIGILSRHATIITEPPMYNIEGDKNDAN